MSKPEPPDFDLFGMPYRHDGGETPKSFFRRAISRLAPGCHAGNWPAIEEGVRVCHLYKQPLPDWLAAAIVKFGRQYEPVDEVRTREDFYRHRNRYEAVVELRERRHELQAQAIQERALHPESMVDINDPGETLEKCFAAVAELLAETDTCSAETVKASFYLIEAAGGEHATIAGYRRALRQRGRDFSS